MDKRERSCVGLLVAKNYICITLPVLSSSLGESSSYLNASVAPTAAALMSNVTAPTPDYGGTCGVNFCSGRDAHVRTRIKKKSWFIYHLFIQKLTGHCLVKTQNHLQSILASDFRFGCID